MPGKGVVREASGAPSATNRAVAIESPRVARTNDTAPAAGVLELRGVRKRFDTIAALDGIDLSIPRGEFVALLGPSGCGKTTLLRIVAGLESPDEGRVLLDGRDITFDDAASRPVNTVFQSYALFPHLSVRENIAFGLRSRRIAGEEIDRRLSRAMAMARIEDLGDRRPETLSGGQRQRVALARAVINEPAVLLLDEPMSALDARLRATLQRELRDLHRRLGTTFILVTHDQEEAMSVADRVVVMNRGLIERQGSPREVYDQPGTRFVADFVGGASVLEILERTPRGIRTHAGTLWCDALDASCTHVCLRPEDVRLAPCGEGEGLEVLEVVFRGECAEVTLGPAIVRAKVRPGSEPAAGARVRIEVDGDRVRGLHG